jgi:hypothetical protein
LHLEVSAEGFDAFGVAAGLAGAQEDGQDGAGGRRIKFPAPAQG